MKTVLLTGATGFLGSHLLGMLLKKGYKVIVAKRSTSDAWRISNLLSQVVSYDVDIDGMLEKAFTEQPIDIVIHTACGYGRNGESICEVVESNLNFGLKLLDACLKYHVPTFCNTDTLLDKHVNDYALSKCQLTEWLQQKSNQIQVINMKLEHMYGPKDDSTKFVSWLLSQLKEGVAEVQLTSGEQLRDFIYIDDVVSAYMIVLGKAAELSEYSEFEVGTGHSIPVKSFIQSLKKAYEGRFGSSSVFLNFGAIPYRDGEVMEFKVDNSALSSLDWKPAYSLAQGLKLVVEDVKI